MWLLHTVRSLLLTTSSSHLSAWLLMLLTDLSRVLWRLLRVSEYDLADTLGQGPDLTLRLWQDDSWRWEGARGGLSAVHTAGHCSTLSAVHSSGGARSPPMMEEGGGGRSSSQ